MFDLNFFVPRKAVRDRLELLLEVKPFRMHRSGDGPPQISIDLPAIREKDAEFATILSRMNRFEIGHMLALMAGLETGPKLLVPSFEQCLALEHVELRVSYEDYEQPYPTVFVEFPYKYYERIRDSLKIKVAPKGAICYYNSELQVILLTLVFNLPQYGDVSTYMNSDPRIEVIEDEFKILHNHDVEEEVAQILRQVYRVILNLNLVLVSEGFKELGYANPKAAKREKDRRKCMVMVGFQQNIKLHDVVRRGKGEGGGEHASPRPHWRRGFYRRQHHGPAGSLVKRVFIKPVFVCASDFGGDISDTGATYRF